jgi:hypothetical protein
MIRRSSTRNPVQVRAVQFYSSLVDTNGCGHVWRERGRVRPATVIGLRPAAAQLRPENSASCGFGQMSWIKCHALPASMPQVRVSLVATRSGEVTCWPAALHLCNVLCDMSAEASDKSRFSM